MSMDLSLRKGIKVIRTIMACIGGSGESESRDNLGRLQQSRGMSHPTVIIPSAGRSGFRCRALRFITEALPVDGCLRDYLTRLMKSSLRRRGGRPERQ